MSIWHVTVVKRHKSSADKVTKRGFEPGSLYISIFTWYANKPLYYENLTCTCYYWLYNSDWLVSHFHQSNNLKSENDI